MTLLEVAIGLVVMVILMVGLLTATTSSTRLAERSRQFDAAFATQRAMLEQLRSVPPDSAGGFDGLTVTVPDLKNGTLQIDLLSEAEAAAATGISLDLDGDGTSGETEAAHEGMHAVCARVRVAWIGVVGESLSVEQSTMLYPRLEDLE